MCKKCNGAGKIRVQLGPMHFIVACKACKTTGKEIKEVCKSCNGAGKNTIQEELEIKIPPKTYHGFAIKLKSDLEVAIYISRHKDFHLVDEFTVGSKININVFDAILGSNININTLSGVKKMKIAPGTQPNTVLRIKDGGLGGDHLVELNIQIPTQINDIQRELLEKIRDTKEQK
jgi:molecular chaperone DnaJ